MAKKLLEVANQGNDLESYIVLREKIATLIDKTESGRDLASLSRQFQIITEAINELRDSQEEDEVDNILQRRRLEHKAGFVRTPRSYFSDYDEE